MDRAFMLEYYRSQYEDPTLTAAENNPQYEELSERLQELQREFYKRTSGPEGELWRMHEEIEKILMDMNGITLQGAYLMGAADRERMLK